MYLRISKHMTWLSSYYIYVLIVTAPGGLESQLGVYSTPEACEAARDLTSEKLSPRGAYEVQQPLKVECRQRVRTTYGK
jgi:hypothetical protein